MIVHYYCRDPRHPAAPLRKHTSTHSDDVTSVHFSSSTEDSERERSRHLLLSGSTDGLVCISNAMEQDEDEAVVYVGNLGSSISQTGWMPRPSHDGERTCASTGAGVWAATDMETFSVWSDEVRTQLNHAKTNRLLEFPPQLDLDNNLDIRDPSVHTQSRTWVTDYFIGCHASEERSGLSVIVGSNEHVFSLSFSFSLSFFLHFSYVFRVF